MTTRIGIPLFCRTKYLTLYVLIGLAVVVSTPAHAESELTARQRDELVRETHARSLALREQSLRDTIAKPHCWPVGVLGDVMWSMSALRLNEKTQDANARLLKYAKAGLATAEDRGKAKGVGAEHDTKLNMFVVTEFTRVLHLFHSKSEHFPARLEPETERALKERLWLWVKDKSKVQDASLEQLLVHHGTENHTLNLLPNYYLILAVLRQDPAYRERQLDDGLTPPQHVEAFTQYFRAWPRERARYGMWVEIGSNTYQKYSWPALMNLHEFAPDKTVRHRFKLLLDLALIEEAQISVEGRRGGGRSRAYHGKNTFEDYKNLLYAPEGVAGSSSHSRVFMTSKYQLPPAAIVLREKVLPLAEPFEICNRVLGELSTEGSHLGRRFASDSALVNVAYRTPSYLLGSTLQDPSLHMRLPGQDMIEQRYHGISKQKRACGMLLEPGELEGHGKVAWVGPEIEQTGGGRPQQSYWTVQNKNVLLLQRITPRNKRALNMMGSYNTGRVSIRFAGDRFEFVEDQGWLFAEYRDAYVAVKFVDEGHEWVKDKQLASPRDFESSRLQRVLMHAGCKQEDGGFEQFRKRVAANPLQVTEDRVKYQFGPGGAFSIDAWTFDPFAYEAFRLPQINGKPVDLRPNKTYSSPFLSSSFGSDKVRVTVPTVDEVIDFSSK